MARSMPPMTGRADVDQPERTDAQLLCHAHIGVLIRFRIAFDGQETVRIVTGELRQVSAYGGTVTVRVGLSASEEYSLVPETPVILRPAEDYTDVGVLLGDDPDYAQFGKR